MTFIPFKDNEEHLEPLTFPGSARLMIDMASVVKDIIGEDPKPGNHSSFAIFYETTEEVNRVAQKVKEAGFKVFKEPWNAFWGQRYAIVEDPDGYKIDLYSSLSV